MKRFENENFYSRRIILHLFLDVLMIQICSICALWIRYDMLFRNINPIYLEQIYKYAPIHTAVTILVLYEFGMYKSLWHFAGVNEMIKIIIACGCSIALAYAGFNFLGFDMPRSYLPINFVLLTGSIGSSRFCYRITRTLTIQYQEKILHNKTYDKERIMVVGAGSAGAMLVNEYQNNRTLRTEIVAIIDDDPGKKGSALKGYTIIGGREEILSCAKERNVDKIIIAMPSVPQKEVRNILAICKETDCELQILPGIFQLVNGEVIASKLRKVELEDLLGRDTVEVDLDSITDYVRDKVVLVTGGGGSIGSELCRQIAKVQPKQLIIFDIYENNAYEIQQELKRNHKELDLVVLIGSVRNANRINKVFEQYKPEIVYHAAAHKHVPLMETSPNEAIKNNVFGTYNVAQAADKYGAKRFVLISTDKAVNPTNIMGASKRICEMIIQTINMQSKTEYVAVRFGNVLGSNGSVIPLFRKQIASGGPVTVTHPDIIRYFMTIPEAVSLVLQAGAYAKGGEIFVLEMGEPVRIADMAKNLIRLSGYTVGQDIDIVYTGLRPGEKLYEEKLMAEEGLRETKNKLIHIGRPIDIDTNIFYKQLAVLQKSCEQDDCRIREIVSAIVTTYKSETVDSTVRYNHEQLLKLASGNQK